MYLEHPIKLLIVTTMLTLCLGGCGGDDPTDPGDGSGGADTQAPTIIDVYPVDGSVDVEANSDIYLTFSEDMDPNSALGGISLSSGTITDSIWDSPTTLRLMHSTWVEGETIVGTVNGLSDMAGNQMAVTHTFSFEVYNSILSIVSTNPADGATDVNRAINVQLHFSSAVEGSSILSNTTVAENGNQTHLRFTVLSDGATATLVFPEPLPASTSFTVDILDGVYGINGSAMTNSHSFQFTTGLDIDTTPPTILSVSPASGSTLDANSGTLQLTFSEPMDPIAFSPTAMNVGFLALIGSATPTWNHDFTVLTVTAPTPLPPGLPLEITFADFADANGNVQTTPWTWQAVVAGTPDYFPIADGTTSVYQIFEEGGTIGNETPEWSEQWTQFLKADEQPNGSVRLNEYDPSFTVLSGVSYELYRKTANTVDWLGFRDEDFAVETLFSTPLTLLQVPMAINTWTSTASLTLPGEGTLSVSMETEVIGQTDVPLDIDPDLELFYKNAWQVERRIEVRLGSALLEVITISTTYAASLGPVIISEDDNMIADNEWSHWEQNWVVYPPQ